MENGYPPNFVNDPLPISPFGKTKIKAKDLDIYKIILPLLLLLVHIHEHIKQETLYGFIMDQHGSKLKSIKYVFFLYFFFSVSFLFFFYRLHRPVLWLKQKKIYFWEFLLRNPILLYQKHQVFFFFSFFVLFHL